MKAILSPTQASPMPTGVTGVVRRALTTRYSASTLALAIAAATLVRSPAAGETPWHKLWGGAVTHVVVDPGDQRHVAASTTGIGEVVVSTDGGDHWMVVDGLGSGALRHLIGGPANSQRLYAAGDSLYTSDDWGLTWRATSAPAVADPLVPPVADSLAPPIPDAPGPAVPRLAQGYEPETLGRLALGHGPDAPLLAATDTRVFSSADDGGTWRDLTADLQVDHVYDLLSDSECGGVYAGTSDGVYRLVGEPSSWARISPGPIVRSLECSGDGQLLFCTQNWIFPTLVSIGDGVRAAFRVGAPLPSRRDGMEGRIHPAISDLLTHPAEPEVIYAVTDRDGIWLSKDGGRSWTHASDGIPLAGGYPPGWLTAGHALAVTRQSPYRVFLATDAGLFVTDAATPADTVEGEPVAQDSVWRLSGPTVLAHGVLQVAPSIRSVVVTGRGDVLAGTPGGRVFRRVGAAEWVAADDGLPRTGLCDLKAGPGEGSILAAVEGRVGLYRSLDAGGNWEPLNGDQLFGSVYGIGVTAADGPRLVAAMRSRIAMGDGGGDGWSDVFHHDTEFHVVAVASWDPATIYAGGRAALLEYGPEGSGMYRSTDGGLAWSRVRTDRIDDIVTLGDRPGWVLVRAEGRLFLSEDGGDTWRPMGSGLGDVEAVAAAPGVQGSLYAASGGTVWESRDAGDTWQSLGGGVPVGQVQALACDPTEPTRLFVATSEGVYVRGLSATPRLPEAVPGTCYTLQHVAWRPVPAATGVVEGLVVRGGDPDTVYVSVDGRLLRGEGGSWQLLDRDSHPGLMSDPLIPETLYDSRRGVSRDLGRTWERHPQQYWVLGNSLRTGNSLAVDPRDGLRQSLADSTHLYETTNGGAYWRRLIWNTTGLVEQIRFRCVAIDPYDSDHVLAGGVRLHRSEDGGRSWRQVAVGVCRRIAFDVQCAGRAYALISGRVWRTDDLGRRWRLLEWSMVQTATSLDVDPGLSGALSAGGVGWQVGSLDGGETWTDMSEGMGPEAELITVARGGGPESPRLYAATTHGLFVADLQRATAVRGYRRYLPERAELVASYPNPFNASTVIQISLPRDEQVELTVFDVLGQVVRRLAEERLPAGAHNMHWDGCDEAGRQIASGVYVVRLRAGSVETARKMALVR